MYFPQPALQCRIQHMKSTITPNMARAVLRLSFPKAHRDRMRKLSAKARAGALTPDEDSEMDDFERAGALLSILKSKARQALKEAASRS